MVCERSDTLTVKVKEEIGSGAYKVVFALDGDDDNVLLVNRGLSDHDVDRSILNLEYESEKLDLLRKNGIPAAKITWIGKVIVSADPLHKFISPHCVYAGAFMKKAPVSNRSHGKHSGRMMLELMNEKTLDDVSKIRTLLLRHKIRVTDIQCLFMHDGSIVLSDPIDVVTCESIDIDDYVKYSQEHLFLLSVEAAAKFAIAVRKGEAPCPETTGYVDVFEIGVRWCRKMHLLGQEEKNEEGACL